MLFCNFIKFSHIPFGLAPKILNAINIIFFGIWGTTLVGVWGAFFREIVTLQRGWNNRILGWVGGAICSVDMIPKLTYTMITLLDKYGLIDHSVGLLNVNIVGLAGLVSNAIGITLMESILIFLNNWFGQRPNSM